MANKNRNISNLSLLITILLFVIITFILAASFFSKERQAVHSYLQKNIGTVSSQILVTMLGAEMPSFSSDSLKKEQTSMISLGFELATNVNIGDVRSLVGNEMPGFNIFKDEIIISGKGTNFTTLPTESSPPLEDILNKVEIAKDQLTKTEDPNTDGKPNIPQRKNFYIYHTHSWESYLPLLGLEGNPNVNKAVDSKTNITIVGEMLGKEMEKLGLGVTVDKTNMGEELKKKGWKTPKSYKVSRALVQTAISKNQELDYFIDLHRDSLRKKNTTVKIHNNQYAKVVFVVGKNNPNYEENLEIAKSLHEILQKKYPHISRGVIGKSGKGVDGVYNQDLSKRSILVEMGGVDNNIDELHNTAKAFADVINQYYREAEKVSSEN
ncbi:stage II sporulation protein P [Bacillus ectoiniformans]|uniref:stage II sporulation protein P n=1 Tax=Bacillus ectoiniformans TaxID=1494429 RepID=UPI001957A16F|nr:stage II sporulation protein P [Bacillus ectoiniformans]MBM7647843.1 stage II sporulation protein P [Bacillus ectoiniformans]